MLIFDLMSVAPMQVFATASRLASNSEPITFLPVIATLCNIQTTPQEMLRPQDQDMFCLTEDLVVESCAAGLESIDASSRDRAVSSRGNTSVR